MVVEWLFAVVVLCGTWSLKTGCPARPSLLLPAQERRAYSSVALLFSLCLCVMYCVSLLDSCCSALGICYLTEHPSLLKFLWISHTPLQWQSLHKTIKRVIWYLRCHELPVPPCPHRDKQVCTCTENTALRVCNFICPVAIICSYHDIWEAAVGQMLLCQKETSNPHVHITYAVLVTKGSNLLLRPFYVL